MSVASEYERARERARTAMFALSAQEARAVDRALGRFVARVRNELDALSPGARRRAARELESRIATEAARQLFEEIEGAVAGRRRLAFDGVFSIWSEAAERIIAEGFAPRGFQIRLPSLTTMGAWEAVGSPATWRSLLAEHVRRAGVEAGAVVREAIALDVEPGEIARRLRRYVQGAEELRDLFEDGRLDLRRVPREMRGAAQRVRFNAERIALTEVHNARGEAEWAYMLRDPLTEAVRWTLAPNRGRIEPPDVCDALAGEDFYGLGPGVFPVNRVPAPPHPFDRCERVPIPRPFERRDQPKPEGRLGIPSTLRSVRARGRKAERILDDVSTTLARSERIARDLNIG